MESKTIQELQEIYDVNIDNIVKNIKKAGAKKVLIQLPEGLKPYAEVIVDEIEKKAKCQVFIWLDSCYGACDIPVEVEKLGIDLIVQFGHSNWNYKRKDVRVV